MSRKHYIIGNWKLHKGSHEAQSFIEGLKQSLPLSNAQIMLSVPFISIDKSIESCQNSPLVVGSQDISMYAKGAYTGEVSAEMVKKSGAAFTLIGHSERRQFFFESAESLEKKIRLAIDTELTMVYCVGETLAQRERGKTLDVIEKQLTEVLSHFNEKELQSLIIAYEPVWAIGTGKVATPNDATKAHQCIRKVLQDLFSKEFSEKISLLYGGSVKPDNIECLMKEKEIDGALVGGASLDLHSFIEIIKNSGTCI